MRSRSQVTRLALGLVAVLAASCAPESTPVPTPLPTSTAIPTSTPSITPTATSTDLPHSTSTLTPIPPPTSIPTITSTPIPTPTPSPIGPFLSVSLGEGQPSGRIGDWRIAPDGTLWLTTDQALASYVREYWTIHPFHGDVLLGFDASGRAWVAPEDGTSIAVWDGEIWTVYGPQTGWTIPGNVKSSGRYATVGEEIITDDRGWTWLVTVNDVRVLDGEQWTIITPEEAGFTPWSETFQEDVRFSLQDIAIDRDGDVWVVDCAWMGPGPEGQGARWFTGDEWRGQDSDVVSSGCIEDIEVDPFGRIWLGVFGWTQDQGFFGDLWRYTPDWGWDELYHPLYDPDWGQENLGYGLRWGWISGIELGPDGTAWVSMSPCSGGSCESGYFILFAVRGASWTSVGTYRDDQGWLDMAFDSRGDAWLCFGSGLYRAQGVFVEAILQQEGFYCQVEADSAGRVWLSILGESTFWLYDATGSG